MSLGEDSYPGDSDMEFPTSIQQGQKEAAVSLLRESGLGLTLLTDHHPWPLYMAHSALRLTPTTHFGTF